MASRALHGPGGKVALRPFALLQQAAADALNFATGGVTFVVDEEQVVIPVALKDEP